MKQSHTWNKLFTKETLWVAATGAALYGANQMYPWVIGKAVGATAGAVDGVLTSLGNAVESIAEPMIWSMAPTLAPMVAPTVSGIYLGKKIGDYCFSEDSVWKKRLAILAWGALGTAAWLTSSVMSPFLVWAGAATLAAPLIKPFFGTIGKGMWALYGGVTWAVLSGIKWPIVGGIHAAKKGYEKPSLLPDIWF